MAWWAGAGRGRWRRAPRHHAPVRGRGGELGEPGRRDWLRWASAGNT